MCVCIYIKHVYIPAFAENFIILRQVDESIFEREHLERLCFIEHDETDTQASF